MGENKDLWVRRIKEEAEVLGKEEIVDMDKWLSVLCVLPPVGAISPPLQRYPCTHSRTPPTPF